MFKNNNFKIVVFSCTVSTSVFGHLGTTQNCRTPFKGHINWKRDIHYFVKILRFCLTYSVAPKNDTLPVKCHRKVIARRLAEKCPSLISTDRFSPFVVYHRLNDRKQGRSA